MRDVVKELPLNRFLSLASVHREPNKKEMGNWNDIIIIISVKLLKVTRKEFVTSWCPHLLLTVYSTIPKVHFSVGSILQLPPRQSIGVHLVSEIQCRGIQIVAIDLSHIQQNVKYAKRNLVGHG